VLQEAKSLGRVLHLNSPGPEAAADLAQIQRWEKEFNLGRPVGCRTEVWANYREKSDGSWLDDPQRCPVAPVFRLGIYVINDLIRLWGEADRVQVLHTRLFTERPTPDNAQLGIQFRNGALANIYASFCVNDGQYYANSLTMNYENGTIYRNVGQIPFGGGKTLLTLVTRQGEAPVQTHTAEYTDGSGLYQWEALHRAIEGQPLHEETTPDQIVAGLRVIAAMTRAEKSEQTERV
jgi:predicted dehydrogenase